MYLPALREELNKCSKVVFGGKNYKTVNDKYTHVHTIPKYSGSSMVGTQEETARILIASE